ncbi:MAG: hypothetical protein AAGA54_11495 [Myxococcota bacterium]
MIANGIIRVLLWGGLLLFVVPGIVLGKERELTKATLPQQAGRLVLVLVALVHVLTLLNLFDGVSLIGSLIIIGVGLARRKKPVEGELRGRDRLQIVVFDLLDGGRAELVRLRDAALAKIRSKMGDRSAGIVSGLIDHAPFLLILIALLVVRYGAFLDYPYPDSSRAHENILRLKRLGAGEVLASGYYPLGAHAFALVVYTLSRVDQMLLWGVLGTTWSLLTTTAVYALSVRLREPTRRSGGATISAALCAFATSGPLLPMVESEAALHAYTFAAPFFIMLVASLSGSQDGPWPRRISLGLLVLLASIHPLSLALGLAALAAAATGELSFRKGGVGMLARCAGYAIVATLVPLGWGLAAKVFGFGLGHGALDVVRETIAPRAADPKIAQAPLMLAAGAFALATLFRVRQMKMKAGRDFRIDVPCLAFLFAWSLFSLPRTGLPMLSTDGVMALLVPLASVVVGLGFDVLYDMVSVPMGRMFRVLTLRPLRQLPGIAGVLAVLIFAPPSFSEVDARMEPETTLGTAYQIKEEFVAGEWTMVAHAELSTHVEGEGWSIPRGDFLERFEVESYKWDPQNSAATVPTSHVFLFVEKTAPNVRYRSVQAFEARADDNVALESWCREYMETYTNMSVYLETEDLVVFHIHRTVEEEREVMARVWEEKRKAR